MNFTYTKCFKIIHHITQIWSNLLRYCSVDSFSLLSLLYSIHLSSNAPAVLFWFAVFGYFVTYLFQASLFFILLAIISVIPSIFFAIFLICYSLFNFSNSSMLIALGKVQVFPGLALGIQVLIRVQAQIQVGLQVVEQIDLQIALQTCFVNHLYFSVLQAFLTHCLTDQTLVYH